MVTHACVRTTTRFGQTKRSEIFASCQTWKVFLLLLWSSKQEDSFEANRLKPRNKNKTVQDHQDDYQEVSSFDIFVVT